MRAPLLLVFPSLVACKDDPFQAEPLAASTLEAGAAEVPMDLPVGTPFGGYTGRLLAGGVDSRESDYAVRFSSSAGIQTRPMVKAFWFRNDQEDLVILKGDMIYSYDGLVDELEARISEATGVDMKGRVVFSTSHSHNTWGNYTAQLTYYLGGDKYNHEALVRLAWSGTEAAAAAFDALQPARVGVAHVPDWDPEDRVYRDRRGDNNEIQPFADIPAGSFKDPEVWMMRVDALDQTPIGVLFGFGMHGTLGDYDNQMTMTDAPGGVELGLQDRFDRPVVVAHFQGGLGDASPAGDDDLYAKAESIGDRSADTLYAAWESIATGADAMELESVSRSFDQMRDTIHVTRDGTVDWTYRPYEEGYDPDLQIWGDNGEVLSPLDEFTAEYGAAFCGESAPTLGQGMGVDVDGYRGCSLVSDFVPYLASLFGVSEEEAAMPLQETIQTSVTAVRMGPMPTLLADGSSVQTDLFMGFFPGEATSFYNEMFRRRALEQLGFDSAVAVAVSQDHEGYLLLTEDWLQGGYEPDINVWGPLQADWIQDNAIEMGRTLTNGELEARDPFGLWESLPWGPYEMPVHTPDDTPQAGTLLTEVPGYLFSPLLSREERDAGAVPDLTWQPQVRRVNDLVQVAWQGGDPAVDTPRVVLERNDGGTWVEVTTHSGRPVTESLPDILLAWTPDPLEAAEGEAQSHLWWAAWQVVGHGTEERSAMPEGEYRLHVTGRRWVSGDTWPFETAGYEVVTDSFTVVPGELDVQVSGADLSVSLSSPAQGFRHIAEGGSWRGSNPLWAGSATVNFTLESGESAAVDLVGVTSGNRTVFSGVVPEGTVGVEVVDAWGNHGTL